MGAARFVVVVSALAAPLAHAAVLAGDARSPWPTVCGLVLGVLAWKRQALWVAGLLGLGPVWQVLAGELAGDAGPHLVMPWLAVLAATLARHPASGWQTTGPWRLGLAAWALSVATAWPVAAARELDFTTAAIGAATTNGVFSPATNATIALIVLAAEAQLVALLLFDWCRGAGPVDRRRVWLALTPGVAAACGISLWQSTVNPAFISREPWITLDRAAGTFYDANAMGALAALLGPLLAWRLVRPAGVRRALWQGGWLALSLAGVMASGSRTALAGWSVAVLAMVIASRRAFSRRQLAAAGLAAVVVVIAGTIVLQRGSSEAASQGNALTRLAQTIREAAADGGLTGLRRVLWDRNGYGPTSMAVIAEHPWFGVGPGAFAIVAPDYAKELTGALLPPDNAQNWWRHQWAELGLLGAAGAFACSLLAARAVIGAWRRSTNRPAIARSAPLMALGFMSFVGPPTLHPILQVLIALVVAHGVVHTRGRVALAAARPATGSAGGWLVWATALTCATGLAVRGWTDFRPPYRAARFHFLYSYGLSPPTQTPLGDGVWAGRRAVGVFPPNGSTFVVGVTLPHDDLAAAPVRVDVSDGYRLVCGLEVRERVPVECRVPMPEQAWPIVRLDISRDSTAAGGKGQAALVTGRFEP
jgi:O-antigen ligase